MRGPMGGESSISMRSLAFCKQDRINAARRHNQARIGSVGVDLQKVQRALGIPEKRMVQHLQVIQEVSKIDAESL